MSTIRVSKDRNYSVINNTVLNDKRLSWKAKGLAAYLLSKPDDWTIIRENLINQSSDGVTAVRSALQELERFGYLTRTRRQDAHGQFVWERTLHETPVGDYPSVDNPLVENPPVVNPLVDKAPLLNTDVLNTDILNTERAGRGEIADRAAPTVAPPSAPPPTQPVVVQEKREKLLPNDSYDLTPRSNGKSPSPPGAGAPPSHRRTARVASPYFDPRKLVGGYIPAGMGTTPTEVYFERYSPAEYKLNAPTQDDLQRVVTDLDKWRAAVAAWQQSGYNPRNVKGMLDWYRDGGQGARVGSNGNGSNFGLVAYAEQERKRYERDFGPDEELTPEREQWIWEQKRRLSQQQAAH